RIHNVITIDDERIKSHLDRVVRGTVEETLNALLDAEAPIRAPRCRAAGPSDCLLLEVTTYSCGLPNEANLFQSIQRLAKWRTAGWCGVEILTLEGLAGGDNVSAQQLWRQPNLITL